MKKTQIFVVGVAAVLILCLWPRTYQAPTAETKTTAIQQVAVVPEPVVQADPSVQTEGVVSNDDGSIVVRGNASFTVAPASNNRPPAMMPESEARKLSSPPTK